MFVDMACNGQLLHDVHHQFGSQLKYRFMVGGTHWEQRETQHALPGAKPTFFFAPTQFQKRAKEWGFNGVESRYTVAAETFIATTKSWLKIIQGQGPQAIETVYQQTLEGKVPPDHGHILYFTLEWVVLARHLLVPHQTDHPPPLPHPNLPNPLLHQLPRKHPIPKTRNPAH